MTSFVFLGGGNMATAIIKNIDMSNLKVWVVDSNQDKLDYMNEHFVSVKTSMSIDQAIVKEAEVVVLAVKPQSLSSLKPVFAKFDFSNKIVVSILSGVTIENISSLFGHCSNVRYIRAMPNMSMTVGHGITGIYADIGDQNYELLKLVAQRLFSPASKVYHLGSEQELDLITPISGSGPAYFFAFIEALTAAACKIGIDPKIANEMSIQTAAGAALQALNSDKSVRELRECVTSRNGTTHAALITFEMGNLNELVFSAVSNALTRTKELGDEQQRAMRDDQ